MVVVIMVVVVVVVVVLVVVVVVVVLVVVVVVVVVVVEVVVVEDVTLPSKLMTPNSSSLVPFFNTFIGIVHSSQIAQAPWSQLEQAP